MKKQTKNPKNLRHLTVKLSLASQDGEDDLKNSIIVQSLDNKSIRLILKSGWNFHGTLQKYQKYCNST